jgi:two-component system cell cycle sensor histidine kinase/response regulator CckA
MSTDPTSPADPSPTPDPESGAARGRGKPVAMLVEDDAVMRAAVRRQLEQGGYEVVESSSGREAYEHLRRGAVPDCLVTDLRMADGSGGWLVSQVGYEFPALLARTVVISGDAKSAGAAHVSARWGCPVLAKPFDGMELVELLAAQARGEKPEKP